ncbi:hypothetical protein Dda_6589 [Drechslerella dactyloides]|uniref:Mg2+ transporter protein n=1 Tax=Drechslerella dactyloides TaxID=74499 RepID=A0AAD6ITT1_DREDA|nr:hypothetical protein Dda_6589 [Drechslerella dactyloides]
MSRSPTPLETRMGVDQRRFATHSHQLFSPDVDNVECLRIFTENGACNRRCVFEKEALQDLIDIVGSEKSIWVLLQPSDNVYQGLKDFLENRTASGMDLQGVSCHLHLDILEAVSSSWGDYIEYSWTEVDKLDDKACLSEMSFEKKNDYIVTFNDCQRLQRLRRRLLRALSALESNSALADGIATRFPDVCNIRIANYKAELDRHRKNLLLIIEHLKGTSKLLFNILSTRNDKVVLDGTQAMQESLGVMGRIAEQGRADSTTLKLLSMIATIYLPASLVATIFSSNLIELKTDDRGSSSFQPVSQFWIYIVLAVALTVVTFICMALVLRRKILEDIRKYWSAV